MDKPKNAVATVGALVAKRKLQRPWKLACAAALAFGLIVEKSSAGTREHEGRDIWFVHATDPHIFLKAVQVDGKTDAKIQEELGKKRRQEELNEKALADMLKYIRSLPGGDGSYGFLVLTGDLGIDPCEICQAQNQPSTSVSAAQGESQPAEADDAAKLDKRKALSVDDCLKVYERQREDQIKAAARILGQSPVPNIYLVAGNNDIANESAGDEALKYFNKFIDDLQKELIKNKSSVVLHNLTRCYATGEAPTACYADIGTDYRLIGFPSYSFKNSEDKAQAKQFETFRQLLEKAQEASRKVLVVTHTPQMDDPYYLAQSRYVNPTATPTRAPAETVTSAETPTPTEAATPAEKKKKEAQATEITKETEKKTKAETQTNKSSSVATWKVSEKLLDDWKNVIASDSMVGVFAGHLHDSHKEIYRRPYAWSSGSPAAFQKLFLAPPLAVKNQTDSPIQARGFSLIHLKPDRVESRLFWYDSETGNFTPDPKPKHFWERHGLWGELCQRLRVAITWLWELDKPDTALVRITVLAIAFLTAFLTVVAVWQIPAPDDPLAHKPKTAPSTPTATPDSTPFANKFGKTVIGGLSGLAITEVAKAIGSQQPSADARWYYIVWFILFFFFLLLLLNFWRASAEAFRARVAVAYYPLARCEGGARGWGNFGDWFGYWVCRRPGHWLSSLQVPLLTFSDTFVNLIQGKNQTRTQVFEKTITDQLRNVIRVADTIRGRLNNAILDQLRGSKPSGTVHPEDVRVNISVLSKDQASLFYISRAPGSSRSPFRKNSLAWISVFTGKIRWYKDSYSIHKDLYKEIVLFDNSTGTIADEEPQILLHSHYQQRSGEDYRAFVMFPVPWPQRGFGSDYVKGAIHISFRNEGDFDKVWPWRPLREKQVAPIDEAIQKAEELDREVKEAKTDDKKQALRQQKQAMFEEAAQHGYDSAALMLEEWCKDEKVRTTLNDAVVILGELLRKFNETIYKNYIEPDQPD